MAVTALFETNLKNLTLRNRGKVRDMYAVDDDYLLIVATDRISAFDVVLPDPIPGKGSVLTALSDFWLDRTAKVIPNHRGADITLDEIIPDAEERARIEGQASIVRKLTPLPMEAIVRGYLIGSGWKDYRKTGQVCGIELPTGLVQASQLPEPIFTPSTKAEEGDHDENIDFEGIVALIGKELAEQVRTVSLELYREAARFALERGIIIADTKFEFGTDQSGNLVLIDEVLTPDSSRFWPVSDYRIGISPPSFDKQFVRDYLEGLDWNKQPPAPHLPTDVITQTAEKYREGQRRLMGEHVSASRRD
uniref:Phosphoribosylaminoimidazole-succinocarboxamide synthase n=1 Tax=Candidatus Kentrum sp. TUN TaxID=2126343 RepID=A0A451AD10_9GAMM|nr:MAG: phosphoribosylaminoimidazole-succinocarboxamide synthase [Candidatus Kentron sp. TUN]VFK57788.1 MAG: phosphoribosylaminoimidazole-succinocarboxamide synthase [Candidatus Kentron sp. TUN]VFK63905.1 MAG: phosphoribosylaminoimidazole-succinocarboxamide synthase [Candidatus Kentron sp. TUN]